MKYTLYHPLTTTTWLFPDQTHSRAHKITKSSPTDSRRLAKIHHCQAVHHRTQKWVTGLCRLAVQGFTARQCL